jgi:tRNA pseudouridine38-40 synthase
MSNAHSTKHFRLDLAYRGEAFWGWQTQPSGKGVQDVLEKALATVIREPVRVMGASRTDSGVHAEHQVAVFRTATPVIPRRLVKSLNALLPDAVKICDCQQVEPDFHPIRDAVAKIYRYRLWRGAGMSPFVADYVWSLPEQFNMAAFREAAQLFCGQHDFKSFCATDSSAKTTVRNVHTIEIDEDGALIELYICGEGFLKQMVRAIVGTLVEVAQERRRPGEISAILEQRDRVFAGLTAPAHGLSLVEILFQRPAPGQPWVARRAPGIEFRIPRRLVQLENS